ncbi:MAG: metallophosphoesterase [Clostridia bacterium]|nr:metallophosphoesterase [Clostridia bacterium]
MQNHYLPAPHRRAPRIHRSRPVVNKPRNPKKILRLTLLFLLIGAVLITGIVILRMDRTVTVDKVTVTMPTLPRELEGYTFLHISDLHERTYGDGQSQILRALEHAKFDAVLLSGDMLNSPDDGNMEPFVELLDALKTYNKPVYFVNGNHDPILMNVDANGFYVPTPYLTEAMAHGANWLELPVKLAESTGRAIWLVNARNFLDEDLEGAIQQIDQTLVDLRASGMDAHEMLEAIAINEYQKNYYLQLKDLREQIKPEDIVVELTHTPYLPQAKYAQTGLVIPNNIQMNVDLILAGHFHGGQFRLPGLGAVYVPEMGVFPDNTYVKGLASVDFVSQYINAGLGASGVNLRLFNHPQVALITLTGRV